MSVESLSSMPTAGRQSDPVAAFMEPKAPLLDVRSPAEYLQGHIPGALNLPLFDDAERAAIGTVYKQQGRHQAVQLGLASVGPRLAALAEQLSSHAGTAGLLRLYCWRGGMRSGSVAWLAGTLGIKTHVLEGGYKRFRRWCLDLFEQSWPLLLLGGRTGCGKTDLLLAIERQGGAVIDLEGLANHRGSSFGGLGQRPQPSTEHFENLLAVALERYRDRGPIWLEAESAQVGRCRIPAGLWGQMGRAAVVELQRPVSERVERLVQVYGCQQRQELLEATARISRRLGPQRTAIALEAINQGDMALAASQMLDYYDRCYDHELERRSQPPLLCVDGSSGRDTELAAQLLAWQQAQINAGHLT